MTLWPFLLHHPKNKTYIFKKKAKLSVCCSICWVFSHCVLKIFSLGEKQIPVYSPLREGECWQAENRKGKSGLSGSYCEWGLLLFGARSVLHPSQRGETSYFQRNPAWRGAFIPHLKITHAAEPWLNWVPNKKQHRRGERAGSRNWTAQRAAQALWETSTSLHMEWPSASRGQPRGCKWQAEPMSLLRLAI